MHELYRKFAAHVSWIVGSVWALIIATVLVLGTGYYYDFSTGWKINTSLIATLTALLLLFFLQKSQNHSDIATHLKLDELIRSTADARNEIVSAEEQTEKDLEKLKRA